MTATPALPRSSSSTPCGEPEPSFPLGVPTWGGAGGQSPLVVRSQVNRPGLCLVASSLSACGSLFNLSFCKRWAGTVTPACNAECLVPM